MNASSKQSYKAIRPQSYKTLIHGFAVFGIPRQTSQASQATGEWVGDEKIAERRVATNASETSQSSPRVFSEIFCSTHPERGANQPNTQLPQSAAKASQLGKFPRAQSKPSTWQAPLSRAKRKPANSASFPVRKASPPTWHRLKAQRMFHSKLTQHYCGIG